MSLNITDKKTPNSLETFLFACSLTNTMLEKLLQNGTELEMESRKSLLKRKESRPVTSPSLHESGLDPIM